MPLICNLPLRASTRQGHLNDSGQGAAPWQGAFPWNRSLILPNVSSHRRSKRSSSIGGGGKETDEPRSDCMSISGAWRVTGTGGHGRPHRTCGIRATTLRGTRARARVPVGPSPGGAILTVLGSNTNGMGNKMSWAGGVPQSLQGHGPRTPSAVAPSLPPAPTPLSPPDADKLGRSRGR